jgi:hypothetical protein
MLENNGTDYFSAMSSVAAAQQNLTQQSYFQSKKLFNEICVYITVLIILTGLVGNILSLKVFCSTKLPRTSSRAYLIALTISDSVFLITHFIDTTCKEIVDLWQLDFPINLTDQKQTMCRSFALLRNACRAASPWIIVAFTLERFLVVIFPQHSNVISKPLLAKRLVYAILAMSVLISLYVPILSGVVSSPNMKKFHRMRMRPGHHSSVISTSSPLLSNYYQQVSNPLVLHSRRSSATFWRKIILIKIISYLKIRNDFDPSFVEYLISYFISFI